MSWIIRTDKELRPIAGALVLMLVLTVFLPMPIGATGLKMDTSLKFSHASFVGEGKLDNSGCNVAIAGDVNGDGYDDIVIGAPLNSEVAQNAGEAYIFFGTPSGWNDGFNLGKASASYRGQAQDDYAGYAVAGAGDVNNDGYDDILVGAYGNDDGGTDAGQSYLILGKSQGWATDLSLGKVDASWLGSGSGDQNGQSVAGVGDVNNDGYDDFLIGSVGNDDQGSDSGRTYLFFGKNAGWVLQGQVSKADASFYGPSDQDWSGAHIAGAGDVNNDGYDDFLIGAVGNDLGGDRAGATYLVLGKASGWSFDTNLKSVDASFIGEFDGDMSGDPVSGAGDVNGDGYDDFLIAAPYNDCDFTRADAGQTYLILGKSSGWALDTKLANSDASFWGERDNDNAGFSLTALGDVDGDSLGDFGISAPYYDVKETDEGQTYIVAGKTSGWAMDLDLGTSSKASFLGIRSNEWSGFWISGDGDVNGDGIPDILIGAANNGDNQEGKTYLYLTFSAPPTPDALAGTSANDASAITLTWTNPVFWNEPISGYRIYKSLDGTNYKHIGTAAPGDQKYKDVDVAQGKTYYYAVVTVDGDGALSGMGSPVAVLCAKDTDGDGLNDPYDADDDADGIPDFSDAFPLDSKEWLDTDMDGTGNAADTDDDNDGALDVNDAQPLNPLNGIQGDLKSMNATIIKVGNDVTKIRTDLALLNGNITALGTEIDNMEATLTTKINALGYELDGINGTMQLQHEELRTDLIQVNSSVHKDITAVATELHTFKLATEASLKEIKDLLAKHDKDMKGEVSNLNKTINSLSAKNLAQIMGELAIIEAQLKALGINDTELMTKITETKASITGFKTSTDSKLQNITTDLGKLDTIQSSINDLKKSQKNTNSKVEAGGTMDTVLMALIALTMVLVIVAIVTGMKKK